MMRLSAKRLDLRDTFQFSIEAEGSTAAVTCERMKAAKLLVRMGINDPMQLIEHVQTWGTVDLVRDETVGPFARPR